MRRLIPALLLTLAVLLLAGCRSPICPWCGHDIRTRPGPDVRPEPLPAGVVRGRVPSLERTELHPLAVLVIQLHDLSVFAGGKPRLVAETRIEHPDALPVPFEIPYGDTDIVPTHDYSLSAKVVVGMAEIFRTDTHYPVITHGAPSDVQLVLMRVR